MSTSKNTSQFIVHDKETLNELDCSDPLKFQNRILRLRKFDDKIINILNSEIPTESFLSKGINASNKCTQLKQEIRDYYDSREGAVKKCIDHAKQEVDKVKQESETAPLYLIREKNYNLRLYQQELEVEHIDRARTEKAVEERCRAYQ